MKKLIQTATVGLMVSFAQLTLAQTVKGVKISEITSEYLEVVEYRPVLSNKVCIRLEFGQKVVDVLDDTLVKDDNGKNMDFDSAINFINKMKNYGYELFQVEFITVHEYRPVKYYILKRKQS